MLNIRDYSLSHSCSRAPLSQCLRMYSLSRARLKPHRMHKELLVKAGWNDNVRTIAYTGRPMRVFRTPYIDDWYVTTICDRAYSHDLLPIITHREINRQDEIKSLTSKGIIPADHDIEQHPENRSACAHYSLELLHADRTITPA